MVYECSSWMFSSICTYSYLHTHSNLAYILEEYPNSPCLSLRTSTSTSAYSLKAPHIDLQINGHDVSKLSRTIFPRLAQLHVSGPRNNEYIFVRTRTTSCAPAFQQFRVFHYYSNLYLLQ